MQVEYNLQQQTFLLSMFSNLVAGAEGTVDELEEKLRRRIEEALNLFEPSIGLWEIAWGPAIYQAPHSKIADNAMYVAKKVAPGSRYVVAIAGSNGTFPFSFDYLIENFQVSTQVPWRYGEAPAGAEIALGNFIGFTILSKCMRPGPESVGSGLIRDFLKTQTSAPIEVTVTGHSLGGALSPTLALWLSDTRSKWDEDHNATLGCLPSAGYTGGNGIFASYYDSQLKDQTTRIYNPLDVVPNGWATADIETVPTLYEPYIPADDLVRLICAIAIRISRGGDYTQILEDAKPLDGTVDQSLIIPGGGDFANFVIQGLFQHLPAYLGLLGIDIPLTTVLKPVYDALDVEQEQEKIIMDLRRRLERERLMA